MDGLSVTGFAIAYRLFDVGYALNLEKAAAILRPTATARLRPGRGEARAIQIQNPPLLVPIGAEQLDVNGTPCKAEMSARLYDFGVCALQIRVVAPSPMSWEAFTLFGTTLDTKIDLTDRFQRQLHQLLQRLGPAVERPAIAPVTEDYVLFRILTLRDASGAPVAPSALTDDHLVPLLLGEQRRLSEAARRELLPHRFSYYGDDLTILTWDNALLVEPDEDDGDIEYLLEFANAQLLELRVYDALLDAELPAMYDRIEATRKRWSLFSTRLRGLLADLQTRVADITEIMERAENALKVTDDVYLARIYAAALEIFRGPAWRAGIERKLAIIRDTYVMLYGESQAARMEALEVVIIVLIVAELVIALR
jgi:hypothetical protein